MAILTQSKLSSLFSFRFDAECHQPDLLRAERIISRKSPRPLSSIAHVTDGNHVSVAEHFSDTGVRYLKGAEVGEFFVEDSSPTYIPETVHARMTRAHVNEGDILVSVVGTVGPVSIVTKKYPSLSCSCKLAILKPHAMSSASLAIYLSSDIGQQLLRRRTRGSVQQGIILPDLRSLPVPSIPEALDKSIKSLVKTAFDASQKATNLYPEAERELLERFGWDRLKAHARPVCRSMGFATLAAHERVDAEYYHPDTEAISNVLKKEKSSSLDDLCHFIKHGMQPPYADTREFGVVSQRQFSSSGLELDSIENFTSTAFAEENPDFVLRRGDVLTYCVSAGEYLGRTFLFNSLAQCVAASFVTILRTNKVNPGYLALFLNSPIGLTQTNALKRGTSPFYLYPRDIKGVKVYVPRNKDGSVDSEFQNRLAKKASQSAAARADSLAKIDEAKLLITQFLKE